MIFRNTGLETEVILNDNICLATIIMTIMSYATWMAFFVFAYPLQFNGDYSIAATSAIVISFFVLCAYIFLLDRIYVARIYHLKTVVSRKEYRNEMRELSRNWKDMYQMKLESLGREE